MLSLESNSFETVVILGRNDEKYEGSYRSPLSSRNRAAAAANACLAALRHYLGESSQLNLVDFQRHTVGGQECFLVAVSYQTDGQDNLLLGYCFDTIGRIGSPVCCHGCIIGDEPPLWANVRCNLSIPAAGRQ